MNTMEGILYLNKTIQLLRKISRSKEYDFISPLFETRQKILLKKSHKGFLFSVEIHSKLLFESQLEVKNASIRDNKVSFKSETLYITKRSFSNLTLGIATGKINCIHSEKFDLTNHCYHRMVIPTNEKLTFGFSNENVPIEYSYDGKSFTRTRDAIGISLESGNFLMYRVVKKVVQDINNQYLIIDCDRPICYPEFAECCYSILIGFGFIAGTFVQNEGFFFQYKDFTKMLPKEFYYSTLRDSIKCSYIPVYSNPHGYISDPKIAELYKDKARNLTHSEFSKMCSNILSNDDFRVALLLILESNTQSLVSSPGILSIALETLAKIIYDENEERLAPITDKNIAKNLRNKLKECILEFNGAISEEGFDIVNKRIEQINQRTNREKLLIPFKILKIPINSEDIEAIEQRNSFLHGKIPMIQIDQSGTTEIPERSRYYLYLKLYTLVSSIILKYCGFNNLIVNFPKIYEDYTEIKLNEGHYKQI